MTEQKKRCPGCGAVFQSVDENLPGYLVPGKKIEEGVLCKRCFQMKHYGVYKKALISDPAIQKEIKDYAAGAAAVFLILDVTRPELCLSDLNWAEKLDKPVFVIANKADLLEPWITRKELLKWLSERTGVSSEQIILLSAHNKRDMADLRRRLEDTFSADEKVLFAGTANAGKSTILSEMLKKDLPTVSRLPGTTVGITEYHMTEGPVLADAPGLKGGDPFVPVLCPDCLALLSPKKIFQSSLEVLKTGQTVFFGGLAQITVSDAGERGWVRLGIFAPDSVTVHRTKEERISDLLKDHTGEFLIPPCRKCAAKLEALAWKEEVFHLHPEEDLAVPGIGWVALYSGACTVKLRVPDFVNGIVRPWLVPSPARRQPGKKRI
jgi:ribosome biogenesis GTPase A